MNSSVEELLSQVDSLEAKFGDARYIYEAVVLDRQALVICTPGHPQRAKCLTRLSTHLWKWYERFGGIEYINEAIDLDREALVLRPPGDLSRPESLNNLSIRLWIRYKNLGGVGDLSEAIGLDRDALALRPPGHPDRSKSLNNLAVDIWTRYNDLNTDEDLQEATDLHREALMLRPPGHKDRALSLTNLATCLWTQYYLGRIRDLTEAISLEREALSLCPPEDPLRSLVLSNLAVRLGSRYCQLGESEDLNEAISLDQQALTLRPPGHPKRGITLINHATRLCIRFKQLYRLVDLTEAINFDREALALFPRGHSHRALALNNLALHLLTRYQHSSKVEDLDEAIVLNQEVLVLRPPGHIDRAVSLHHLADNLFARYELHGGIENLAKVIALSEEALVLLPPEHQVWSTALRSHTNHLSARYAKLQNPEDREKIFSLYSGLTRDPQSMSSDDLFTARAWVDAAERFCHPDILHAYETAIGLLVRHITALPLLPQRHFDLKTFSSSLAVDAFSACLRYQSPSSAIELLEQGRGVFWNQLTRLRPPLDDVLTSSPTGRKLAEKYGCLTSLIRSTLDSASSSQHDRVCQLNSELKEVVSSIRQLPGFSRFLLPPLLSDLRHAARDGPVIIVNASQYSCDALVVSLDSPGVHIPLSVTKEAVQELASKLRTLTSYAKREDVSRELLIFLRELWDRVVSCIVDVLLLAYPRRSRIWWCPTADFSLLPLHAAAPYRKGQKGVSDLYISSYTPTLSALIRARQLASPTSGPEQKRFIVIGQENATGTTKLQSVGTELEIVRQQIGSLATFTLIEGEDGHISRVTEELSKSHWLHLACHGIPNRKQPFDSAFALHDGRLTVRRISQCDLQNAEFAYLSACHTTAGDRGSLDEVIHLAAAMQFAGFRSVIGTMWAVDDAETHKITSAFYKHVVDGSGRLDHTRVAYALWKTMRSVDVPLDQRILYIHLGV